MKTKILIRTISVLENISFFIHFSYLKIFKVKCLESKQINHFNCLILKCNQS